MKMIITLAVAIFLLCCKNITESTTPVKTQTQISISGSTIGQGHDTNPQGHTIAERFPTPKGFNRTIEKNSSFAHYLRHLPLKSDQANVTLYDGSTKANKNVHAAVVDLDIGNKNLHQCADAIIRLRGEYLWSQERYAEIHFNFTNGFKADYIRWRNGDRIVVNGSQVKWRLSGPASSSYESFWSYMETIFMYAGTLSLNAELIETNLNELRIGDVFIQGGSPGHAIIVVDMATQSHSDEKLFLLAQSYMPAQEIHILKNPINNDLSPWYSSNIDQKIITPEWTFNTEDLKKFKQ